MGGGGGGEGGVLYINNLIEDSLGLIFKHFLHNFK